MLISTPLWSIAKDNLLARLNQQYQQTLIDNHMGVMRQLAQHKLTLDLLQQRNQNPLPLTKILEIDKNWSNNQFWHNQVTNNPITEKFAKLVQAKLYGFSELMLVDTAGALVAAYPLTSDFWQGDEEKFIVAMNKQMFSVTSANWDHSTQRYSFFVTVPIQQDNLSLGALIAGLAVTPQYMQSLSKASQD
ncbi:hypothetical protein DS2_07363 [Catenovulum agarivorans DS-2]|uniref:Diguanylate cyclase n=1 Tax=Catenovulum agarivorans DS-2 TaxID=1328313 RepID=W7QNU2_9ALTE|nr:hypothetical protein DS2_07363 [Catenovulum agarivorans DS-2]